MQEKFGCQDDSGQQDSQLHIPGSWLEYISSVKSDNNSDSDSDSDCLDSNSLDSNITDYGVDHDFDAASVSGTLLAQDYPYKHVPTAMPFPLQIELVIQTTSRPPSPSG